MCYQCDSSEDIRCSEELVGLDLKPQPCNPFSESKYCVTMTGIFGGTVALQPHITAALAWDVLDSKYTCK